ncbi:hypothetical protein IV203_023048 [Nitzschia inconspicua]|uniref:Uncharacterized protein n=1 Tax=Nitzschia inconspicua TaxID=303405 RepID=A0A9K3PB52_9STRA|nr:hypothetical protein IV203_023048 [Nitzschia inconspicua]
MSIWGFPFSFEVDVVSTGDILSRDILSLSQDILSLSQDILSLARGDRVAVLVPTQRCGAMVPAVGNKVSRPLKDDRGVGGGAIEGEDPRRLAHSHCRGMGNTVGNKSATTGNILSGWLTTIFEGREHRRKKGKHHWLCGGRDAPALCSGWLTHQSTTMVVVSCFEKHGISIAIS